VPLQQREGEFHSQTGNLRPTEAKIKPVRVREERAFWLLDCRILPALHPRASHHPQAAVRALPGDRATVGTQADKAPGYKRDLHVSLGAISTS